MMSAFFQKLLELSESNTICSQFSIWLTTVILSLGVHCPGSHNLTQFIADLSADIGIEEEKNGLRKIYDKYLKKNENEAAATISKAIKLCISNRLYVMSGYELNDAFQSTVENLFATEVEYIDFRNNNLAAERINAWIEVATEKRILRVISGDMIGELTRLVIVSCIYFKAQWEQKFETIDTTWQPFHVNPNETVHVAMMNATIMVPYADIPELAAEVIELPYRYTDLAMLIILPKNGDILQLLESMKKHNLADIKEIHGKLMHKMVDVNLPKFSYETTINLKDILQQMGIYRIFEGNADFSGLLKTNCADFRVSNMVQKAFINVTEDGTEAAAATSCCLDGINRYDVKFLADRPFYFCIKDKNFLKFFDGCFKKP